MECLIGDVTPVDAGRLLAIPSANMGEALGVGGLDNVQEVIRIGGYLGWSERDVARFAEWLTGCSWANCHAAELGHVVGTYAEIASRIRARLSNVKA